MKLTVTLATILLALSVATFHGWKKLKGETAQLEELGRQIADHEKTADLIPGPLAADRSVASATPPGPGDSAIPSTVARSTHAQAAPDFEDLRGAYSDLARDLGLTQAEADNFLQLIARQRMETQQLIHSPAQHARPRSAAMLTVREKTLANEAEQAAMLGEKYPLWKEHQLVVVARGKVKELQTLLVAQGGQLTEGQMDQLVAAMAPEIASVNKEFQERIASVKPGQPVMGLAVTLPDEQKNETNRRMIAVAASHLSPSQLDRFRQMLARPGSNSPSQPGSAP